MSRFMEGVPTVKRNAKTADFGLKKGAKMRLIDADALRDLMEQICWDRVEMRAVQKTIDEQPTIDPVKRGKWIKIEGMSSDYYCSECEQKWWTPFPEEMHYCPNCGAEMT